ncbi:MAG: CoA transferase [Acidimicrobiia bacterium]|nr:CoA transferase [Acidimicrobiia bacterium]MDH3397337.1 CoA transferase [Acidimicrobiia bacterium]
MTELLAGMRVIEGSAFVAAPLGGMTLAQLGADVIRFDPIGGGLDYRRWPVTDGGQSLYWAGLNKGKRSIALDLHTDRGRDVAISLITAPGADAGLFLTNYPPGGWADYGKLVERRPDLIMCQIVGNPDGSTAVDYTINAAVGYPLLTGPGDHPGVVNSVLPAWDLIAGVTAATGLLAADRHRTRTGQGRLIRLPLADVALAALGHLGYIGEVTINDTDRPRYGNYLYGAFGRDFVTSDGRRVMVTAITPRQFRGLLDATGLQTEFTALETRLGEPLRSDGDLFEARQEIAALLETWFEETPFAEVAERFAAHRVLWGPYQTVRELLEADPRASVANPLFAKIEQPGIGPLLTPGSPLDLGSDREPPRPAPLLGQHTEEILTEVLELSSAEIAELHDRGVVASG